MLHNIDLNNHITQKKISRMCNYYISNNKNLNMLDDFLHNTKDNNLIIYIKTDIFHNNLFENFLNIFNKYKFNYIFVTGYSDYEFTENYYFQLLKIKNFIKLYATNCNFYHEKINQNFIGLQDDDIYIDNIQVGAYDKINIYKKYINSTKKNICYMNHSYDSSIFFDGERKKLYENDYLKKICLIEHKQSFDDYCKNLSFSKFFISPHGNGIDCHKTYEALYMNTIPIVKKHPAIKDLEDLPVLIVDNYEDLKFINLEYEYNNIVNNKKMQNLDINIFFKNIKDNFDVCNV